MSPQKSRISLPLGSLIDRYLILGFMRIFLIGLAVAAGLYFTVDFFDRIDNFLETGTSLWNSLRYFFYKLPVLVSRVFGFAALFSTLFFLNLLSRNHEIMALRSSGLPLRRITFPLILFSLLICAFTFFWNETLVPIFTRKSQDIYRTEVRKKPPQTLIGSKDIWMRGKEIFVSADHFDTRRNVLEGISIYLLNEDFSLRGVIEVPWARWDGARWEASRGTEWLFSPDGQMTQRNITGPLPLYEPPQDFKWLAREPEEFGFSDLRKQIADLKAKGIDATEYEVDLQVKLALPLISPLMVLLAVPFGLRQMRGGGIALSFGLSMLIGLCYWFVLHFSISLGHSGALPPWIAAWLPNLTLTLVGLYFFSAEE